MIGFLRRCAAPGRCVGLAVAGLALAGATLAAGQAEALPSWSYHWTSVSDKGACMDRAWSVISDYEFSSPRRFKVDHTTDSVIEVEFASVDVVALLMCSPTQFTVTVFGTDYEAVKQIRADLSRLF